VHLRDRGAVARVRRALREAGDDVVDRREDALLVERRPDLRRRRSRPRDIEDVRLRLFRLLGERVKSVADSGTYSDVTLWPLPPTIALTAAKLPWPKAESWAKTRTFLPDVLPR
jgi:hypothetical protein